MARTKEQVVESMVNQFKDIAAAEIREVANALEDDGRISSGEYAFISLGIAGKVPGIIATIKQVAREKFDLNEVAELLETSKFVVEVPEDNG